MKSFLVVFTFSLLASSMAHGGEIIPAAPTASRPGILLMAHGGRVESWNEEVRHVADQVDLKVPTEIAFGMATRSTLQAGIDRLIARGVTEIVAVPLFVSSHSSVIESTAYLLGLRPTAPEDLRMFASMDHSSGMKMSHDGMEHTAANDDATKPIHSAVPVRLASALDHHAIVADILLDRASTISQKPANEIVVLVAHGPVPDDENLLWLKEMQILANTMRKKVKFSQINYLTVRDDADEPVRNRATTELRQQIQAIGAAGKTALVVPLLLSYGGIENGLRDRLKGLSYKMPDQGLLPDQRIAQWVLSSQRAMMESPSISH